MKFTEAAGANATDTLRVLGRPTDRIEGPLKVSGRATYAAEFDIPGTVHGVVVGTTIATGRIVSIDVGDALAVPGVLGVVTHENAGKLGIGDDHKVSMLAGPRVDHLGQAAALVVAEGFEIARAAARLVRIDYAANDGAFDLAKAARAGAEKPFRSNGHGGFDRAFADAPVQVDATYTTPDHAHAMMEPYASIAAWEGDRLTLWTANQMVDWAARDMAKILGMPRESVRIIAHHIGGGFGGKLWVRADAVLAAVAARQLGRPVKVVLTRHQMFNNTTHRSSTIQRLRLGADRGGRLQAIAHESWSGDLPGGSPEGAGAQTRQLYAAPNRRVVEWLAELNLPESSAMRAPGEAVGMMAIEAAMDELAERLSIDPVELRILNDTQVDPEQPERRFSHRDLVGCLREGAERFGWSARSATRGQRRDGRWLIGMGMAAAYRGNMVVRSAARVALAGDGQVTVTTDMTDIGTGSYTILAQTAAEMLGVDLDRVTVRLGDLELSGIGRIRRTVRREQLDRRGLCRLCRAARQDRGGGRVRSGDGTVRRRSDMVGQQVGRTGRGGGRRGNRGRGQDRIRRPDEKVRPGDVRRPFRRNRRRCRYRRDTRPADAGRVCRRTDPEPEGGAQPDTGCDDDGGGRGADRGTGGRSADGGFINHDLAEYHVPTHADIPHQEVVFLDEEDPYSSPMKAKGVGELGICGVGAAVANAVYNATGVRVRDYPITLDKVLAGLG